MATVQGRLDSILSCLVDDISQGKYGWEDDIDEQAFKDDLGDLIEDIDDIFYRGK